MMKLCNAPGHVRCRYRRNLKPLTDKTGCGYENECPFQEEVRR